MIETCPTNYELPIFGITTISNVDGRIGGARLRTCIPCYEPYGIQKLGLKMVLGCRFLGVLGSVLIS
jgi:hypothetical protein